MGEETEERTGGGAAEGRKDWRVVREWESGRMADGRWGGEWGIDGWKDGWAEEKM